MGPMGVEADSAAGFKYSKHRDRRGHNWVIDIDYSEVNSVLM